MKNPQILDLYTDYLIASFNFATATGMSELLDGPLSQDQISRFLGQSLFTQQDYWKCIKPLVRRVEHPDGVIKTDDTILDKPHSPENEIICWHWDHSLKPKAGPVKGINILNFLYQSPLGAACSISIPVAFEIVKKTEPYFDKKSGKVKMRSPRPRTKWQGNACTSCTTSTRSNSGTSPMNRGRLCGTVGFPRTTTSNLSTTS